MADSGHIEKKIASKTNLRPDKSQMLTTLKSLQSSLQQPIPRRPLKIAEKQKSQVFRQPGTNILAEKDKFENAGLLKKFRNTKSIGKIQSESGGKKNIVSMMRPVSGIILG